MHSPCLVRECGDKDACTPPAWCGSGDDECGACTEMGRKITGTPCLVPESASVCPRKLVRVCGEERSVDEIVVAIEKNAAILNASGGGVTFSGGEPLCQSDFLLECLRSLKGKVNRALQTCGYADCEIFSSVLEESDYVLYDLKLIDGDQHKRYTGVSNEKILANYRTLAKSGKEFVTRIPLIPTVNDTEENIEATARFMSELGVKYIEILPYNKMAGGKYAMVGREYTPSFDGEIVPQPRKEIFASYGIEVKVL